MTSCSFKSFTDPCFYGIVIENPDLGSWRKRYDRMGKILFLTNREKDIQTY